MKRKALTYMRIGSESLKGTKGVHSINNRKHEQKGRREPSITD